MFVYSNSVSLNFRFVEDTNYQVEIFVIPVQPKCDCAGPWKIWKGLDATFLERNLRLNSGSPNSWEALASSNAIIEPNEGRRQTGRSQLHISVSTSVSA